MTALFAFDGASPFDLASAKRHGAIAAMVYIVGRPGGFAPADAARVNQIRALGMGAIPNWERAPDFFLTCSSAEAKAAGAEARTANLARGFPADGTVRTYFSVDTEVPRAQFPAVAGRLHDAAQGQTDIYQAGMYGQNDLIDYVVQQGALPGKHWLTESTFGLPEYNPASPYVCVVQNHDVHANWLDTTVPATDINTITDPYALGAWWPDGSPYGGLMSKLDNDDKAWLLANVGPGAVWAHRLPNGDRDWQAGTWLTASRLAAAAAAAALTADGGVLTRLAQLQQAVAAQASAADPGAFAQAVLDKFKALLGVGGPTS